jgi:Uma2 family endonuclease
MTLVKELDLIARTHELRIPMSYEEFLTKIDESIHAEWVNGEAIIFMPPTSLHQNIVGFLFSLLREFTKLTGLGQVFVSPLEMKVAPAGSGREPDVLFVAAANVHRITDKKIEGPADLVIEVISDESVTRDRSEKFYEYQDAAVREYWLIDARPGRQRADFWVLGADGRYRPVPLDEDDVYRSTLLTDFWLDTNWLWQDELPDVLSTLAQIVGTERLIAHLRQAGTARAR